MTESEDHAELNRLVSGELPDREALALMRRMLRDAELREAYNRLTSVDELMREAYLSNKSPEQDKTDDKESDESERVSGGASAAPPEADIAHPDRRRKQIAAILERIDGSKRLRHAPVHRRAVGWARGSRALPWTLAASLAVTCTLLFHLFPTGSSGSSRQVRRMDPQQAALYKSVRNQLGDTSMAVIWTNDGVSEVGNLGASAGPTNCEVILRVTIVRTSDDEDAQQWSVDALMRRDQTIELVTQPDRTWPASVKVRVAPGKDSQIPVSVEARVTADPPVEISNQRLFVSPSEPAPVGSVTSGPYRYELFIEAIPASAAAPAA